MKMKKNEKKQTFREDVAKMFVEALKEDPIEFIRGWDFTSSYPENAFTGKRYKGVNLIYLSLISKKMGYDDYRWMTFKQITEKGYHLTAGSKGTKVEYWLPYDRKEKKWMAWEEFKDNSDERLEDGSERYLLRARYYTVFNASMIEGIEALELDYEKHDIDEEELIERISDRLGVTIEEKENSSSAYYAPLADKIMLPEKEQFHSQEDYVRTALHELGHSTGHESRLNRDIINVFGTEKYAYEELVAEITSALMGEFIEEPVTEHIVNQHKAYVQSWASAIENDKNFLFQAIKDAETATDFIIEHAQLREFEQEKLKKVKSAVFEF